MKKIIAAFAIILCCFASSYPQGLNKPTLISTWIGGEDYYEFFDNTVNRYFIELRDCPQVKAVVRICSYQKLPTAMVASVGYSYRFFDLMRGYNIPSDQIYLARSSRCVEKSKIIFEQYWLAPKNITLENDEIILAEKVHTKRLYLQGNYENEASQPAKNEFNSNVKTFIKELKNSPKSEGFIVSNWNSIKTNRNIRQVLQQIKKESLAVSRVKVIRKKTYYSLYPELFIISISE